MIQQLKANINNGQIFFVIRRNAPLQRVFTIWKREMGKGENPGKRLMVHFAGEDGIDDGALSKTFLTNAIYQIASSVFNGGVPKDSMLHVQNGDFRACGQIVAYSLTHDGPPPCFLDNSMVSLLFDGSIDKIKLEDSNFTKADKEMLTTIAADPEAHADTCFEHRYTGVVNKGNAEVIVKTIMASMVTRRLCYLEEFKKGLIFELSSFMLLYPDMMKPLFSLSSNNVFKTVDGNYIVSLLIPKYSEEQSTRRQTEETIIDFFQDFLHKIDNGELVSQETSVAWKDARENEIFENGDEQQTTERAKLTAQGMLQWITGQEHKPINPDGFYITVHFEHECFKKYPEHKLCYPIVSACGRSITLPVPHMKTEDDFNTILLTGYCQGQSFSRH
ncbi:MAG: hypothetical protein AAFY76_11955 [Cyanobacteria bacterium J06649_11]